MGNTLSSWGGGLLALLQQFKLAVPEVLPGLLSKVPNDSHVLPAGKKKVQSIITSAGLPLQIDDNGPEEEKGPLSPFTEAYPAKGWFTGVRSRVTIPAPPAAVYKSLSKDLHKVFTPMTECEDDLKEDDGQGRQVIFRVVRIPFKVAFVAGNLKLRLHVEQDSSTGKIHFESVKEGRLITRFVADFEILSKDGTLDHAVVVLDAKVNAQSLPPPPFKGMVKDVMVRKMDSCMVDLVHYHTPDTPAAMGSRTASASVPHQDSQGGFLAGLARSLSRRASLEKRRPSLERRRSERSRGLDWRRSLDRLRSKSLTGRRLSETRVPEAPPQTLDSQAAVFSEWQTRVTDQL